MKYQNLKFIPSRIPPLDTLSAFVPTGQERNEAILKASSIFGYAKWYPVEGGHKVLYLYKDGPYDEHFFTIEKGAWNHEHCKECGSSIPSMTLCWVTESGPFIVLCEICHDQLTPKKTPNNENAADHAKRGG